MKILISTLMFASLVLTFACGGGASGNASNSTKINSNSSSPNNSSSSNPEAKTVASDPDRPAINKDAFDFFTEIKESSDPKTFIGRSVTVTDLDLKEIESSTLHLGYSWYFFVDCEGSFADYLSVKDVVAKRAKDKPVQATVKGVIKEASKETVKIEPCVLTDIKK